VRFVIFLINEYWIGFVPVCLVCLSVCLTVSACLSVSGQQGNLTERVTASVLSLLLILAVFVGALYLLLWQTYVLWLEAALIFVEMTFLAFEVIFAFISVVTFARSSAHH